MTNIKVHVLGTGHIEQDRATLVTTSRLGNIYDKTPSAEWTHTPVYSVLIEHPDGLVLFDTSCNPKGMTERWQEEIRVTSPFYANEEELLLNRLEKLGVRPDDIRYVVISHLHVDHSGGLEFFRKSEIIVHETEFTQTIKKFALKASNRADMGVYIWDDINAWMQNGLHWKLIPPNVESFKLFDGVTILNFGSGHAFGVLGMLIELPESGNILLASDAVYTSENYGPPVKMPGILYDSVGYVSTIERIREIAKEKNAAVWFGHDKDQFESLIKSPDGYYE
jgi:N-acyl homoserine lactone hydrolase